MPHSAADIHARFHHVVSHSHHTQKNSALDDMIQGLVTSATAESKALGATDAMLQSFTDTQHVFKTLRPSLIRVHLVDVAAKEEAFTAVHGLITWSRSKALAAGATEAMLKPFDDIQAIFTADRGKILAMDMS